MGDYLKKSIQLTGDIFNKNPSQRIKVEDLVLEDGACYCEEDRIFEQRTCQALKSVESNPNRKIMTLEEFLKELEIW